MSRTRRTNPDENRRQRLRRKRACHRLVLLSADTLRFTFTDRIHQAASENPLRQGDLVTATSLADVDQCTDGIWVTIRNPRGECDCDIPLEQLEATDGNKHTATTINDWKYWIAREYWF